MKQFILSLSLLITTFCYTKGQSNMILSDNLMNDMHDQNIEVLEGEWVLVQAFEQISDIDGDIDADLISLNIYPNPTTNYLNLFTINDIDGDIEMQIYDLSGKQMGSWVLVTATGLQADVSGYAPGNYIVKVFHNHIPVKSEMIQKM